MQLGKKIKRETWIFPVEDDVAYLKNLGTIEITFINDKWVKTTYSFSIPYTKEQRDFLAEISGKITEIERQHEETP